MSTYGICESVSDDRENPVLRSVVVDDTIDLFNEDDVLESVTIVLSKINGLNEIRARTREAVYRFLRAETERSQRAVVNALKKLHHPGGYRSFWISNVVVAKNITGSVLNSVLQKSMLLTNKSNTQHVLRVERTRTFRRTSFVRTHSIASTSPNWNIEIINADKVWDEGVNGSGVTVATLDGGVTYDHPALVDNYRGNLGNGTFDHNRNWKDWAYKRKVRGRRGRIVTSVHDAIDFCTRSVMI